MLLSILICFLSCKNMCKCYGAVIKFLLYFVMHYMCFQQFIKDEAINVINFYYSFEKYNQKKIKDLAAKVCQEFKSSCSWSLKQATYFIKMLFKENSHQPFQVSFRVIQCGFTSLSQSVEVFLRVYTYQNLFISIYLAFCTLIKC